MRSDFLEPKITLRDELACRIIHRAGQNLCGYGLGNHNLIRELRQQRSFANL